MGNCQSSSAAIESRTNPVSNQQLDLKAEQDSSSSTHNMTDDNNHSLRPGALPTKVPTPEATETKPEGEPPEESSATKNKKKWADKRGYSSGGSSEPELGESFVFGANDDFINDGSSRRECLDRLHLTSMRNVMHSNGNLTQAVVRLETPFGKPIEEIYDGVHDGVLLGEGVSGIVRLVQHRETGVQYACKVLDIGLIQTDAGLKQLREEISIMCQLDHPNIVRIEEVYESTNTIYLLQELCLGGDLFDRLDELTDGRYTEGQCAKLVKQMVSSVRYLHSKSIIHRDLKLENFLFSSASPDSELKMIDFGLSKHFGFGDVQHEAVGTPYTVAPEVIRGNYDESADIWSVGVLTFLLLSGETPFGGDCEGDELGSVRSKILRGSFDFEPEDIWNNVSDLSKKFVKRLLNVDPKMRPTARDVQRDEWLLTYATKEGDGLEGNQLSPKIVDALVSFKEYGEMRRFLHEVLSFTLLPEQIIDLREEFQKIDSNGDGEITLDAMKEVLMNTAGGGALGGLTEEEVEDIFNALRVNKNDSTIRWHEFIAACLSQCKVDDRNLKLAFDRLDTDRKGYISFDDLTDLLGHSEDTVSSLKKMWTDSMKQCRCKQNRISYDDFLVLMKGQKRNSNRPSLVWDQDATLVLSGIEDSLQELSKSAHFGGVRRATEALPAVKEPQPEEGSEEEEGPSLTEQKKNWYARKRSKSFDNVPTPLASFIEENTTNSKRSSVPNIRMRPSMVNGDRDSLRWIADESRRPLIANREQYKRHRDLRMALLEASKDFDLKCQSRRFASEGKELGAPVEGAGLIMKRGAPTPKHVEDAHQQALFDAAVRRGGRQRGHRRRKTQSDVTGMIIESKTDDGSS